MGSPSGPDSVWRRNCMDRDRRERLQQAAWMNYILIIVNVLVFLVGFAGSAAGLKAGMYSAGALYAPLLFKGQGYYRLLTSVFLHADLSHLFNNMIVQFAGGGIVERNIGHIQYGILYILCGIGGNIASAAMDYLSGQYGFSVGASGAVFGVIGALLYMVLREAGHMRDNAQKMEQMKSLVIRAMLMTIYLLYSGWVNPLVNQAAHVGGLILGFVLASVMMPNRQIDLQGLFQASEQTGSKDNRT